MGVSSSWKETWKAQKEVEARKTALVDLGVLLLGKAGREAGLSHLGVTTHPPDDCAQTWKKYRCSRENEGDVGKMRAGPGMFMEKSVKPWENGPNKPTFGDRQGSGRDGEVE